MAAQLKTADACKVVVANAAAVRRIVREAKAWTKKVRVGANVSVGLRHIHVLTLLFLLDQARSTGIERGEAVVEELTELLQEADAMPVKLGSEYEQV